MKYRLKFKEQECIGCFACMTACIAAHHDCTEEDAQSFRTIRRKTVPSEQFQQNVCAGCIHCGKCASVCPKGALCRDPETMLILAKPENCVGCRACEKVCPMQVIRFDAYGRVEKCDGCIGRLRAGEEPACAAVCFLNAIELVRAD